MGVIRYGRTAQIGVYPGNQSGRYISYRSGGKKFPLDPDTQIAWDFAGNKSLTDSVRGLTLDFTRTSLATYYDANGDLQTAFNSEPRFDHDPITKESLGLLIEESRTNEFFDSSNPVTRSLTTTAQDYSISVWGTGSMTLSGSATGTVTEGNPLTVTATAGTLTCTVNGSLDRAQVEAGSFPTSYIETPTVIDVTATRAADVCSTTDVGWYNNPEGTFYTSANIMATANSVSGVFRLTGTTLTWLSRTRSTGSLERQYFGDGANGASNSAGVISAAVPFKDAVAFAQSDFIGCIDGALASPNLTVDVDTAGPTSLELGTNGPNYFNGHLREFGYANVRKDNTFLQDITTP